MPVGLPTPGKMVIGPASSVERTSVTSPSLSTEPPVAPPPVPALPPVAPPEPLVFPPEDASRATWPSLMFPPEDASGVTWL